MKKIMGIDLGLNGAICSMINTENYKLYDMPTIKIGKKNDIDLQELINILKQEKPDIVIFEEINNIYKVSKNTMFSLGKQYGYIKAICTAMNINYYSIEPKKWQKILIDVPRSNIQGNYKETFYKSISLLSILLDNERIDKDFKIKTKYHDGKVDAYMLAYYYNITVNKLK